MKALANSFSAFFVLFVTGSIAIEVIKGRDLALIELFPILVVGGLAALLFGSMRGQRGTNAGEEITRQR